MAKNKDLKLPVTLKFEYGGNKYLIGWRCSGCNYLAPVWYYDSAMCMGCNAPVADRIRPTVKLISYSIKNGKPTDEPLINYNVTKLIDNPFRVKDLRSLNGKSKKVQQFLLRCPRTDEILSEIVNHAKQGYNLAVGCYGSKHRSVALVEMAAAKLATEEIPFEIIHRDLKVS